MRQLLPLLPKPSKYLGIEPGSVRKDSSTIVLRFALAFPDKYEVGMSYLGQKILYSIVNANPRWQAERVFAPDIEAAAVLRAHNTPLATLETDTPLGDVDAIGFSVTHELCYTNVLFMLDLAGIPLRASTRAETPGKFPLVLVGGGCTTSAEPLAPFADAMLLGEGEDMLPEVLAILETTKKAGGITSMTERTDLLRTLASVPGVYVPEFFAPDATGALRPLMNDLPKPTRRVITNLDAAPYPSGQVLPFGAVHNRLALEIARGCTRGCRFCQAGMTYRPVRERSVANLSTILNECLSDTGYGEVSFLSLSTGDFSALKMLFSSCVTRCAAEEISLSLPSLRVGSVDDSIMGQMAGIRRTGATLAPEAGSQRLRDVINKGVTENDLICHVQKLFEHGWQQIKLYFMIGLPTETDDDIRAIADLCRKARDAAGPGIKRLQITAGVSPFVPKPHTPFQWEEQIPLGEIRRRVGLLLDELKKEKRITMRWHDPETSFLEGIFSRGDRRLAPVVERAYAKGAVFASWMEHFSLSPWLEAMHEEGLTPEDYQKAIPLDVPLPWEHIENGISREFLLRERANALLGTTVGDCRYGVCLMCGACDKPKNPSLLPRLNDDTVYANRLNYTTRDQKAHAPILDAYGRVVPRIVSNEEKADTGKKRPPELPPHLAAKVRHYRLWYKRSGLAVYLSQLELQSLFERAFRRADIPLSFSQGFHPLPLLSFSRALPVGVASEGEWLCIHLREQRSASSVVEALGEIVPGLVVYSAETLPLNRRPADASEEAYTVTYTGDHSGRNVFMTGWSNIAAADTLPWVRTTKKGERETDARAYFADIRALNDGTYRLTLTWENGYVSPLALARAALEGVGAALPLHDFLLTKLRG